MNFIFPMGGLSQRFTNAGYKVPKFMLDLHGYTVFEHAVIGFSRYFKDHNFVFAFQNDPETEKFVVEKCFALGIPECNTQIVRLDGPTSGQAETVWIANQKSGIDPKDPIVIFNIDSFQSDFIFPPAFEADNIDGYLEVFIGQGDHWSFAEPGPGHSVIRVTEKERVSDFCSSGLYYFKRAKDFNAALERTLGKNLSDLQGGERYVAPLYNDLISSGMNIQYHLISTHGVTFCGTPDEYTSLLNTEPPATTQALRQL